MKSIHTQKEVPKENVNETRKKMNTTKEVQQRNPTLQVHKLTEQTTVRKMEHER